MSPTMISDVLIYLVIICTLTLLVVLFRVWPR